MDVIEYIDDWHASSENEKNNPEFIAAFKEWCQDDDRVWRFDSGENGYCGFTATIAENSSPFAFFAMFELAYSESYRFVKVFTSNHNGYWVPEYIDLKGEEAQELLGIIKAALLKASGF